MQAWPCRSYCLFGVNGSVFLAVGGHTAGVAGTPSTPRWCWLRGPDWAAGLQGTSTPTSGICVCFSLRRRRPDHRGAPPLKAGAGARRHRCDRHLLRNCGCGRDLGKTHKCCTLCLFPARITDPNDGAGDAAGWYKAVKPDTSIHGG